MKLPNKNKKLLLVSYHFPPMSDSRSIRMFYFAKYLCKLGWNVDILTAKSKIEESNFFDGTLQDLKTSLRIYRTHLDLITSLLSNKPYESIAINKGLSSKTKIKRLIKYFLFPDKYIGWLPYALPKGISLVKINDYDVILSCSSPNTSHLISYILSSLSKKPLVLEYGDLWAFNPFSEIPKIILKIHYLLEKLILQKASKVIVTTKEIKENYLSNFRFLKEKDVEFLYSGYDREDLNSIKSNNPSSKFCLIHTGNIYSQRSSLKYLFNALSQLITEDKRFRQYFNLIFVGSVWRSEYLPEELKDYVHFEERVPLSKSIEYMKRATVLLLLGNEGGLQVPLKTFFYIGVKKPILTILGDSRDPLKFLDEYNRGLVVENEEKKIKSALCGLFNLWRNGGITNEFDLSDLPGMFWSERINKLNNILNNLLKNRGFK